MSVGIELYSYHHLLCPIPCSIVSKEHFSRNVLKVRNCPTHRVLKMSALTVYLGLSGRVMPSYKSILCVDDRKTSRRSPVFVKNNLDVIVLTYYMYTYIYIYMTYTHARAHSHTRTHTHTLGIYDKLEKRKHCFIMGSAQPDVC